MLYKLAECYQFNIDQNANVQLTPHVLTLYHSLLSLVMCPNSPDSMFCLFVSVLLSLSLSFSLAFFLSVCPSVRPPQVICVHDVSSIYRVPLLLEDQGVVGYFCRRLDLPIEMRPRKMLAKWKEMSDR